MTQPNSRKRKVDVSDEPIISDSRFANIQSDPRYRLPGKRQKIKLDKRFSRALQDEDFSRRAKVDRYGRPVENRSEKQRLKKKYEFEEDDSQSESDEPDDDEEVQRELKRVEESRDVLRQGKDFSSSEEESSSDEDSELEETDEDRPGPGKQQGDVPLGEVSTRMAVVNLDWDNIRAEDLFAVFSSFLPATGRLLKVAIYPSEFGRERMEREEIEGPPKEIFAPANDDVEGMSDTGSEEEENDEELKDSIIKPDDGSEFDSAALRQYQLDRLRYFYAVLTFSNIATAKHIYDAVDGTEYLSTANFFDLRFVPDETDFSDDKPREECEKMSAAYKPNDFVTDALQHSKVKLTWDAEDGGRKEAQARAFRGGRKEIDENDLKAYLGSDSESEPEEDEAEEQADENGASNKGLSRKEAERNRMRALLGLAPEPVKKTKKEKDVPVGNIQITFSSGLAGGKDDADEGVSKKKRRSVFENSPEPEETTMEKYIRKEKERKQRRKEKTKAPQADEEVTDEEEDRDLGFEDPFFAEPTNDKVSANKIRKEERLKKKKEREAEEAANTKQRAELELLMADENNEKATRGQKGKTVKHFDMTEIEKAEKAALKKNKNKHKNKKSKDDRSKSEAAAVVDTFEINTADPRFARLYENHEFAIDPTNPKYKGTKNMKALLDEGRKRKSKGVIAGEQSGVFTTKKADRNQGDSEIQSLVEKIKSKNR